MQIKNLLKKILNKKREKLLAGEKRHEKNGVKLSFENENLEKRSGKMEKN